MKKNKHLALLLYSLDVAFKQLLRTYTQTLFMHKQTLQNKKKKKKITNLSRSQSPAHRIHTYMNVNLDPRHTFRDFQLFWERLLPLRNKYKLTLLFFSKKSVKLTIAALKCVGFNILKHLTTELIYDECNIV